MVSMSGGVATAERQTPFRAQPLTALAPPHQPKLQVIAGKDKGKVSTVLSVDSKTGDILVEGANIKTKHIKPVKEGEQARDAATF